MEILRLLCFCCSKTPSPRRGSDGFRYKRSKHVPHVRRSILESARPYTPDSAESTEDETGGSVHEGLETYEGRRVTTRARYTYELEGYKRSKHVPHVRRSIFESARPYTPDSAESTEDETGGSVHEGLETYEGRRVTTRARYTYELEGYEKNAMLIFAQTEPQRELIEKRVELLKRSFGQFGFEAVVHADLGPEEIEARLENFFSSDFSRVGAVCVAVVGGTGEAGQLPAGALRCHESRVLDRLTSGLPAALVGRPRIYITDVARTGAAADSGVYSLPITSQYPDVIAIHIPVIIEGESSPLQMLCDRLGTERDLKAEVMAAAHEAETAFPALAHRPIQVDSTLTLELELVKRGSLPGGSSIQGNLDHGENGSTEKEENRKVFLY